MADGAVRLRVEGRVQGVGFRWFVRETAVGLGLGGWVRNLPDGSVEVSAVGDAAALERLRERLLAGPRHARVERLVELADGARPEPRAFVIAGDARG